MTEYNPKRLWRITYLVQTPEGPDCYEAEVTAHAAWSACVNWSLRNGCVDTRAIIKVEELTQ